MVRRGPSGTIGWLGRRRWKVRSHHGPVRIALYRSSASRTPVTHMKKFEESAECSAVANWFPWLAGQSQRSSSRRRKRVSDGGRVMARREEQARRNPDALFPGISSCHNPESFHGRGELALRQERSLEGLFLRMAAMPHAGVGDAGGVTTPSRTSLVLACAGAVRIWFGLSP